MTYWRGEFPVTADSEEIADMTERTFAFIAASLASEVYPESARNPTVANIAKMVITTMSSTRVKAENLRILRVALFESRA